MLSLPTQDGGQGLVDIRARIKAVRLQTAQTLLYGKEVSWAGVACALLRKAGDMGLDCHLFLMDVKNVNLTGLTMLKAWTLLTISREVNGTRVLWLRNESLLFNPVMDLDILESDFLRKALWSAKISKIGQLIINGHWISVEVLASKIGLRSLRMSERLLNLIRVFLPQDYRRALETHSEEADTTVFPELNISANIGEWQETEGNLLSFKTPELNLFSDAGKKALYILCVKMTYLQSLESEKESKWQEVFGSSVSPKGCWRSLYKPPIEKRSGDLQWRIVHSIIATNRHRAHLDPQVGEGCPFCRTQETVFHLFLSCSRLQPLFVMLEGYCHPFGEIFTPMSFIYGPKYRISKMQVHVTSDTMKCFGCGKVGHVIRLCP